LELNGILEIGILLWLSLGALHDKEPDFCDLLVTFHVEGGEFDLSIGEHSFKGGVMKVFCFLHLYKSTIVPRLSENEVLTTRPTSS